MLPYDKDRRWFKKKLENLLQEFILYTNRSFIIPTLNVESSTVKLFCYGDTNPSLINTCIKNIIARGLGSKIKIYTFFEPYMVNATKTIIFIDYLDDSNIQYTNEDVESLKTSDAADLKLLAKEPENEGFNFLSVQYCTGKFGPIFVERKRNNIIGAVGPIDVAQDNLGIKFCLPPYIGVTSNYRNKGVATKLWSMSMKYAAQKGAKYVMIQAESDKPAEYFYKKLGLKSLGTVFISTLI
jgi:GNAT superfamily N-acetyltransferase